jgi:hypothetical protein
MLGNITLNVCRICSTCEEFPTCEGKKLDHDEFGFELPNYPLPVFSDADDGGISSGGSTSSLVDNTKYWNPGVWVGALLIISIDKQIYFTNVVSNTGQTLFFTPFPSTVKIFQNNYILKRNPAAAVVSPVSNVFTSKVAPAAGTYYSTMVDFTGASHVLYQVINTCDQPINVQAIGNLTNNNATAGLIDGVMAVVPINGIVLVQIDLDDWTPFSGLQIVIPGGVTIGTVVANAITRS